MEWIDLNYLPAHHSHSNLIIIFFFKSAMSVNLKTMDKDCKGGPILLILSSSVHLMSILKMINTDLMKDFH